jgi:signal peptidase I
VIRALRVIRGCFRALWVAGVVAVVSIVAMPHVLGAFDRQMYVVRGASMTPDIALGAVVVVHEVDPAQIRVGDVITFRAGSGVVVTHRVTQVSAGSQLSFATKGDASDAPDPVVVPAEAVVGVVELDVPALGLLLTTLASTGGTVLVLGLLVTLLLGGWFIDELVATVAPLAARRSVAKSAI